MTHGQNIAPNNITASRRRLFWSILIAIPILLLFLLEGILRWIDYGGNLDLVVTKRVLGTDYYTLNRDVARRYFSQKEIAIPEPYDDIFRIHKSPHTKRIFMLGESTMAGFPYEYNATAPRLLADRLAQLLPEDTLEVINAGLSAVNSYTVLDFLKELIDFEPDAFVVYVGHNEFYGAMGVGSTEYLGQSRPLIELYLKLLRSKLFLLVRDGVRWCKGLVRHEAATPAATLMEAMVGQRTIPYNSDEYQRARTNFVSNLREILAIGRSRHIPIVVSTLTSNLRDQPPLQAIFNASTGEESKKKWNELFQEGMSLAGQRRFLEATAAFRRAVDADSMNAEAYFYRARCLDSLRQFPDAKREYMRARDLDGLRFRATAEFNDLIRTTTREFGAPLADADSAFDRNSPNGIVGNNLILEHLHPNFDGYVLLARVFCDAIAGSDILAPTSAWRWERNLADDEFKKRASVTPFDLEVGRYKISQLTARWPFQHRGTGTFSYHPSGRIQETVGRFMKKELSWSEAHYALGDWYTSRGRYDSARAEFSAIAKVQPYYYLPLMMIGDTYRDEKSYMQAEASYARGLALQDSPFLHVRMGMLFYELDSLARAVAHFNGVFESESRGTERMDAKSRSIAYYFLGVTYGKMGQVEKAKTNLRLAVQVDPGNRDAQNLLSQLH